MITIMIFSCCCIMTTQIIYHQLRPKLNLLGSSNTKNTAKHCLNSFFNSSIIKKISQLNDPTKSIIPTLSSHNYSVKNKEPYIPPIHLWHCIDRRFCTLCYQYIANDPFSISIFFNTCILITSFFCPRLPFKPHFVYLLPKNPQIVFRKTFLQCSS